MPIYTLSERAGSEFSADVCVIGAGIAGLFAATRLATGGKRILVLESGGRTFDPDSHSLNEVDNAFNIYRGAVDGRFRGLGGTSTHWAGRLLPLTAQDIGDRRYIGVSAWPIEIKELYRYRSEIERVFEVDGGSFEEDILDELTDIGWLQETIAISLSVIRNGPISKNAMLFFSCGLRSSEPRISTSAWRRRSPDSNSTPLQGG